MASSAANCLVLYAGYTDRLSYYDDWFQAFERSPLFDVTGFNIAAADAAERLRTALPGRDLIVLLHSTNGDTTEYLEPLAGRLADRQAPLVSFVGNEVNLPGSPIFLKRQVLEAIGADYIATQLLPEAGEYLWGDIARRGVLALPHALNPDVFRPTKPDAQRTIDIGVRAARYLPHLGDDERNRLHALFADGLPGRSLRVDISDRRFNRDDWAGFLNDCRGTVSSEAGSWFIERDDTTVEAIRAWTAEQTQGKALVIANDSPLRRLGHRLPWWMRAVLRRMLSRGLVRHESTITESLPFQEIHDRFFAGRLRPEVHGKCISSRHFDAIGTGTCQILLQGRYNDMLRPREHYLELARDYGNLDEVLDAFEDPAVRAAIATAARDHVMAHHTYQHRAAALHAAVSAG